MSGNGQAWSSPSPGGQRKIGENGGDWPNDPCHEGIDDEDNE